MTEESDEKTEDKQEWVTLGSKVVVSKGEAIKTISDLRNTTPSHLISELLDPVIYYFELGQQSVFGIIEVHCCCGETFIIDSTSPEISIVLEAAFSGWHDCQSGQSL